MKILAPLLSGLMLCVLTPAAHAAGTSSVHALQVSTSALIKQAAALLTAGRPAQAAALYLRAGDAAVAAEQLDTAAEAYQKAADAFHLANNPGGEATAYERQADVYMKQAGLPPAAATAKSAAPRTVRPTPARPAVASAANPLIGRWLPQPETNQLISHGVECAYAEMVYTAKTFSSTTPPVGPFPARHQVADVTYNLVDPHILYVMLKEAASEPQRVRLIDRDHIQPDAADMCIYRRAG